MPNKNDPVTSSPAQAGTSLDAMWSSLRGSTPARIGLPRSGPSLGTPALLEFRLAHARARDAVHAVMDVEALERDLAPLGLPVVQCHSAAQDRQTYLVRPDLGRRLDAPSRQALEECEGGQDLCIVVSDGLSATAAQQHAAPLLDALAPLLRSNGWTLAPLVVLRHGRVATGDGIGQCLGAACVLMLIGERPGLSSPDSLGAYLTWAPRIGRTDAERNCVSNIRPAGLALNRAAAKIAFLLDRMRAMQASGVAIKDDMRESLP